MADKTPQDILKEAVETAEILKDAFTSLGATIKSQLTANLMDADDYTKQYIKSLKSGVGSLMSSLGKSGDKLIDNQLKLNKGQLSSKDISKQLEELESKKLRSLNQVLTARKNEWISSDESRKLYDQINESIEEGKKGLEDQAKAALKIENNVGVLGRAVKGLNKIPVLGNLIESEKVLADIQESAAKKGANRLTTLGAGLTSIGKSIGKNLFDPLTAITFLLNSAFKADKQVTALAKSLVITKGAAEGIRQEFVDASRAIGDSFITTDKLLESQTKLSDQLGITKIQSIGLNKEFTTLTGKIGLSEEAAGGLAKISIASGKAARQVTTNTIASIEKVKQETGLRLNNQKILEATGKVSGQLLANFRANPAAIAEAIAKTQALGTSLEQAKAQGESLLNFESSIENELKAELVTGKQINLERARMAALMGDQKTVAEELSAQAVDFNTFSNMNVIAQKSLAEALGTSADALSDQLFKQQYLNKSKEEIIALGGEEAAQRMEALSAQDKFNSAVTKLQDLLGNVMAGPLGQIIDGMANIASSATAVRGAFIAIAAVSLAKTIGSIATMAATLATSAVAGTTLASSLTLGLGAIAIVGSIAAIIGAMNSASDEAVSKSQQVQDGIAPSNKGPFTITDNFGATAITSAGDSLAVSPNINRNNNILGGGTSVDLTPMIAAINEVKAAITQLGSRPSVAYINGKDAFSRDVSTTSVQNTYKLA
jgi:hypothetical protein